MMECSFFFLEQDKIAEAGAIQYAVRSLARDVQEGRNAVSLLLELSKNSRVCEQVGKVQGCILLLVTMSNCADQAAAEDAKQILTHLSNNNQNVVQMAEANHFKPLVQCLFEGISPIFSCQHFHSLRFATVIDI